MRNLAFCDIFEIHLYISKIGTKIIFFYFLNFTRKSVTLLSGKRTAEKLI